MSPSFSVQWVWRQRNESKGTAIPSTWTTFPELCVLFCEVSADSIYAHLYNVYLWTDNACHNVICVPEEAQVDETLYFLMIEEKHCDMRYPSKDKHYTNQSSMSKNFYNICTLCIYLHTGVPCRWHVYLYYVHVNELYGRIWFQGNLNTYLHGL